MKRFVTYLYECERGNKIKNAGFIRINVRDEDVGMEVYLRNVLRTKDEGEVFALVHGRVLQGICLDAISVQNGKSDCYISFQKENMMESGFAFQDIEGIAIRLESGTYIASSWRDDFAEEITRGEFSVEIEQQELESQIAEAWSLEDVPISGQVLEEEVVRGTETEGRKISCEKIDLSQIRDLPSPNWHYATNSFLVHGFWNYGYLVLKKVLEAGQETISLGVPGIFEKPEAVMAVFFGFPSFETLPTEMVGIQMNRPMEILDKEKNQETKSGSFGCWFVDLKM